MQSTIFPLNPVRDIKKAGNGRRGLAPSSSLDASRSRNIRARSYEKQSRNPCLRKKTEFLEKLNLAEYKLKKQLKVKTQIDMLFVNYTLFIHETIAFERTLLIPEPRVIKMLFLFPYCHVLAVHYPFISHFCNLTMLDIPLRRSPLCAV